MSNHHCWNYLFFPIIAVLIWYFSGCAPYKTLSGKELVCSGGSINYATYGNAAFPFWCNLTDIEATTLEKADLARSGDPDALLDLAIFASGNIREKEVYEQLGAKIRSFVQTIAPAIDTIREPKEKARALYTAICKAFYHKSFLKNELSGYQYEQSRMTELLRRGKFNCVSSSLLCLVIYRYFDFDVRGVILPSHVFLQLNLPDGRRVEIETTGISGYDFLHDDAYFKNASAVWASRRGLQPMTREEYRNRQIVAPFETVLQNMNNQHTVENRMAQCDRNRLHEALGVLDENDPSRVSARLGVYNNDFKRFNESGDYLTAFSMYKAIGNTILPLIDKWQAEPKMVENICLVLAGWAYTLMKNRDYEESLQKTDTLLSLLDTGFIYYTELRRNAMLVPAEIGILWIEQKRFDAAQEVYRRYMMRDSLAPEIRDQYRYLMEAIGSDFFSRRYFFKAIAYYDSALAYASKAEDKERIQTNIESAFLNAAGEALKHGQTIKARDVLIECGKRRPRCQRCLQELKRLR